MTKPTISTIDRYMTCSEYAAENASIHTGGCRLTITAKMPDRTATAAIV